MYKEYFVKLYPTFSTVYFTDRTFQRIFVGLFWIKLVNSSQTSFLKAQRPKIIRQITTYILFFTLFYRLDVPEDFRLFISNQQKMQRLLKKLCATKKLTVVVSELIFQSPKDPTLPPLVYTWEDLLSKSFWFFSYILSTREKCNLKTRTNCFAI